jgi:hypothetical protein
MNMLTCAATRRRLQAYHDQELSLNDQIAVSAHLAWCDPCSAALADLERLRTILRGSMPGRIALSSDEDINLQAVVVNQMEAETTRSFRVRAREAFGDMHLVYAGLGGIAAALACVVVALGMMRFALASPEPLPPIAEMVGPGSNLEPVSLSSSLRMPRPLDEEFPPRLIEDDDTVFTLAAVVTREGRIGNIELLAAAADAAPASHASEAKVVEDFLGAASRTRFQPASREGMPVAVNMVWIVAHTTVRGPRDIVLPPQPPAVKKRTA